MNFDRYLATSYPLFHRTSVTKKRLLTLFAIISTLVLTFIAISVNNFIISFHVCILIVLLILAPPVLFINYKLFVVSTRMRRNKRTAPEMKKTFSLNHVTSCLLVVACFVMLSIPAILFAVLWSNSTANQFTLDNATLAEMWTHTISSMSSTFNCLIFYWKNKVLRNEGWKVVRSIKISRGIQSHYGR